VRTGYVNAALGSECLPIISIKVEVTRVTSASGVGWFQHLGEIGAVAGVQQQAADESAQSVQCSV